jgi:hypothetical protein
MVMSAAVIAGLIVGLSLGKEMYHYGFRLRAFIIMVLSMAITTIFGWYVMIPFTGWFLLP